MAGKDQAANDEPRRREAMTTEELRALEAELGANFGFRGFGMRVRDVAIIAKPGKAKRLRRMRRR